MTKQALEECYEVALKVRLIASAMIEHYVISCCRAGKPSELSSSKFRSFYTQCAVGAEYAKTPPEVYAFRSQYEGQFGRLPSPSVVRGFYQMLGDISHDDYTDYFQFVRLHFKDYMTKYFAHVVMKSYKNAVTEDASLTLCCSETAQTRKNFNN